MVEIVQAPASSDRACGEGMPGRRSALAYAALPRYASAAFWKVVESAETSLETLVKCLRVAALREDMHARTRILAVILERTQDLNELWARSALRHVAVSEGERRALVDDLRADLSERMVQALLDPERAFWEENFLHCLRFERKHVYHSFMLREGRWSDLAGPKRTRIPRALLVSLDQQRQQGDDHSCAFDVEDERAQAMLQAVEYDDLLHLVLHLPDRLKAVVLLIFWEGRSEKDTARALGVSDRTVRNRLRKALRLLRGTLVQCPQVDRQLLPTRPLAP